MFLKYGVKMYLTFYFFSFIFTLSIINETVEVVISMHNNLMFDDLLDNKLTVGSSSFTNRASTPSPLIGAELNTPSNSLGSSSDTSVSDNSVRANSISEESPNLPPNSQILI